MHSCSSELHLEVRIARELAGYTSREKAAPQAACSSRYLADIEGGKKRPAPDQIAHIGVAFHSPRVLKSYCSSCPVRQAMNKVACFRNSCSTIQDAMQKNRPLLAERSM